MASRKTQEESRQVVSAIVKFTLVTIFVLAIVYVWGLRWNRDAESSSEFYTASESPFRFDAESQIALSSLSRIDVHDRLSFQLVGNNHLSITISKGDNKIEEFLAKVLPHLSEFEKIDLYLGAPNLGLIDFQKLANLNNIHRLMILPSCRLNDDPQVSNVVENRPWELITSRINGYDVKVNPFRVHKR